MKNTGKTYLLALSIALSLAVDFGVSCCAEEKTSRAFSPAQMIKSVLAEYDAGRYDKAMALCKQVLIAEPTNLSAHYLMGNICVKCNQIRDAKAQYTYCVNAGKASSAPEATFARKALDQIEQQGAGEAPAFPGPGPAGTSGSRMVGASRTADEYLKEQTDILVKEKEEKLAVKRRTMDDKIKLVEEDMQQQIYNLPRPSSRRVAQQEARNEVQDQIKADGKQRIDRLRADFEREKEDLDQAYQRRIDGLVEHYHNVDSQAGHGWGH